MPAATEVNIRPGVSVLSLFRHLNYKPWFAMAEFVDNSLQSYLSSRKELTKAEGKRYKLKVEIEIDSSDAGRVVIRDNAAGIALADFPRAFKPAQPPPDRSGLAEFGVGMKSAACWFARRWTVRTKALGERVGREVSFDVEEIVKHSRESITPKERPAAPSEHYTEITLVGLHNPLRGRTISKIKDHLSSIYREFLREKSMELYFDGEKLVFEEPPILKAPHHSKEKGKPVEWRKDISIRLSPKIKITGFAAIRERASTADAGFALFRRGRLIEGSRDESYRPEEIFEKPNSFIYQRIFGEFHVEGIDVSHTKDGFRWEEHEEELLRKLKEELDAPPLRLLDQAKHYRVRPRAADLKPVAEKVLTTTASVLEKDVPAVMNLQSPLATPDEKPPERLVAAAYAGKRDVQLEFKGSEWRVTLELTADPAVGEWLSIADKPTLPAAKNPRRELQVRLSLAHPFMEEFSGADPTAIEPLLRVAIAIALAEVSFREAGGKKAGAVRFGVNDLLRNALWKPYA